MQKLPGVKCPYIMSLKNQQNALQQTGLVSDHVVLSKGSQYYITSASIKKEFSSSDILSFPVPSAPNPI